MIFFLSVPCASYCGDTAVSNQVEVEEFDDTEEEMTDEEYREERNKFDCLKGLKMSDGTEEKKRMVEKRYEAVDSDGCPCPHRHKTEEAAAKCLHKLQNWGKDPWSGNPVCNARWYNGYVGVILLWGSVRDRSKNRSRFDPPTSEYGQPSLTPHR